MFKILRLFTLLYIFFSYSNLEAQEIPHPLRPLSLSYDVLHYDADVFLLNNINRRSSGVNHISVLRSDAASVSNFYFHLRDLEIDSVFCNDIKVEVSTHGEYEDADYCHFFPFPDQVDTTIVSVYYHGVMTNTPGYNWGGVQLQDQTLYNLGVGFSNSWVSCASHWLPCIDHPGDKATTDIRFHVNTGYSVASNGELTLHNLDNGTDIYEWKSKHQIATYMMNFALSKFVRGEIEGWKKPIVYYTQEIFADRFEYALAKLPLVLDAFEHYWGDYPFDKVGYVTTSKGAMEHQTMISFPTSIIAQIKNNNDTLNSTIAHELSHQWFGGLVTPEDFKEAWLNESFATYSEALYKEYIFDRATYANVLREKRTKYFDDIAPSEGVFSLYDFERKAPSSNYPQTIYQKGALVLANLREFVSEEIFFQAMQNYLEKNAYSSVNTASLIEEFKALTEKDIDTFFAEWIYGKGWPEFDIKIIAARNEQGVYDQSSSFISFKQVQPKSYGGYTFVPVPVTYFDEEGNQIDTVYYVTDVDQKFDLPIMPSLDSISIDNGNIVPLMKINTLELEGITSVEELPESDLSIYPNPVSDVLHVNIRNLTGVAEISISDLQGRVIVSEEVILDGNSDIKLDLNNIPSGTYFLEINNASESLFKTVKIIR